MKRSLLPLFAFLGFFLAAALPSVAQMEFVQNKGQWHDRVTYQTELTSGTFFLEQKGFTVLLHDTNDVRSLQRMTHGGFPKIKGVTPGEIVVHSFAYTMNFLGAQTPQIVPDKPLNTYNNYFIGNDPSKWAGDCKIYNAVTYRNVYPNIDVRYYSTKGQMKYDFIIHPGGNPAAIAMRFDGVKDMGVVNKELVIRTPVGDVKELAPYSYQTGREGRQEVSTRFIVRDNVLFFDVKEHDPTATLVIDPTLIFSSFTGSRLDNWGYTATPGPDGSFYAGGIVFNGNFPVSPGAFQTTYQGGTGAQSGHDIAIFKFSANGGARVYATHLGGSGNEQPHSMIVDPSGNLIVAGRSSSANFPQLTPQNLSGTGLDITITKFNAAGTALLGSVKVGGSGDDGVNIRDKTVAPDGSDRTRRNYGDDARSEVILDAANNIYLSSCTQSSDFKGITGGAFQTASGGAQDGVVMKFNSDLSNLIFGSYLGGTGDDACFVAAINPVDGNLYVAGATTGSTLSSAAGSFQPTSAGSVEGFVSIIAPAGNSILRSSFAGTNGFDLVYGLKFDRLGFPYIMGTTTGNWQVLNAAFSQAGGKQFIMKLRPDLSAIIYSTRFGTNSVQPNLSPIAFLVDRCENVYVSGWGGGINTQDGYSSGTTSGLSEVSPLASIPAADGQDFYFFVLQRDASAQLFGSHFGQNGGLGDHVDGGTSRFDANGIIYQGMCANCGGSYQSTSPVAFPVTPGVWSTRNESGNGCNMAAVKIEMDFAGIGAQIQSEVEGVSADTIGCIPFTVKFKDIRAKGVTYYWNFNSAVNPAVNDATTTIPEITFTFTVAGTYRVRLISEDLNTCNLRDTSYITIRAGDNRATLSFDKVKIGPCTSTEYQFTNTTTAAGTPSFDAQSFVWDFGDGSPTVTTGLTPPINHTFPGPGTYIVKLTIIDIDFCNTPDTLRDTLRINPVVEARFRTAPIGCAPYTALFINESLAGTSWLWDFGDGTTSTDFEPTHIYTTIGNYTVTLTATDPSTCNLTDISDPFTIRVLPKPTAIAGWSPNPPQVNVPVTFTNSSLNAVTWFWNFGDGETSAERAPVHEYNGTGQYNAYLVAINEAGCTDTARLTVDVIINPLLDVPNAFTPGKFGINSVVTVRGFGIGKMTWRIYNRWGQLVFQSGSKKSGWDGTFKGQPQPVDVYTYTLDAEFTDGKKLRKSGDITLLR